MNDKKKTSLWQQITRFAVVGGSAFLIDYGIMILLTELCGINYLISSAISFTVSVIYNYLLRCTLGIQCNRRPKPEAGFLQYLSS